MKHSLGIALAVSVCLCAAVPGLAQGIDDHVDRTAIRQQIVTDVDLWNGDPVAGTGMGAYESGFDGYFYVDLNRDWTRQNYPNRNITSISQSRAVYSNVEACRAATALGQDGSRFRQAAQAGADLLISSSMWDTTHDGWYWSVGYDTTHGGFEVRDDKKHSYGNVHPVFALAEAYTVTGDAQHLSYALQGMNAYTANLGDPGYTGAYRGSADRDWSNPGGRDLDYMCHAFETWYKVWQALPAGHADKSTVRQMIENTGNHIMDHMVIQMQGTGNENKAFIPWHYESDWSPVMTAPDTSNWWGNKYRYVSPGHNLEYAYLFSRAVQAGVVDATTGQTWLDESEKLINYALEYAFGEVGTPGDGYMGVKYDRVDFGAGFDQAIPLFRDDNPDNQGLTWWPQAEAARCLAHWAELYGKTEWWDEFDAVYALIQDYVEDDVYGGWYASLDPDTLLTDNPYKGSEWKVNYHAAMMYAELSTLPEPGTLAFICGGGLLLALRRRRRAA